MNVLSVEMFPKLHLIYDFLPAGLCVYSIYNISQYSFIFSKMAQTDNLWFNQTAIVGEYWIVKIFHWQIVIK